MHQYLVELLSLVIKIMYWCLLRVYVDNLGCLGFLFQLIPHSKGNTKQWQKYPQREILCKKVTVLILRKPRWDKHPK